MYLTRSALILHREGLLKWINDGLEQIPATYSKVVPNTIRSRQAFEQIATFSGLGFFIDTNEAEGTAFDTNRKRYVKTYTPQIRTLGIKYTKQAQQKDLYNWVKAQAPLIAKSAIATKNFLAFSLLQNGFGSMKSPDNVSLFSSAHPLADALPNQSNLGTSALDGLALEDALQTLNGVQGERGIPKYAGLMGGYKLVVGAGLQGIATRSVKSQGLQGTNDNDTNEFVNGNVKEIVVDPMLDFGLSALSHNWFLIPAAAAENPLVNIQVQDLEVENDYDMVTRVLMFGASFEDVWDTFGWRGLFGAQVS